jgi:hypothetical protein
MLPPLGRYLNDYSKSGTSGHVAAIAEVLAALSVALKSCSTNRDYVETFTIHSDCKYYGPWTLDTTVFATLKQTNPGVLGSFMLMTNLEQELYYYMIDSI